MNHGIDWEREVRSHTDEDYIFGASSPDCIAWMPVEQRLECLPFGEVQRGREDMMDCASRAPLNILEMKLNYMLRNGLFTKAEKDFLVNNGYVTDGGIELSDAFIAILSGTTRNGNSLKEPIQAIREHGVIPKSMLPLDISMTWEQYHDPKRVTERHRALGLKFKQFFTIWYERVALENFDTVLDVDSLDVAGYAWVEPVDGVYPASEHVPNHAFMNIEKKYFIFDNYRDSYDDDFIKHLAEDYSFLGYGYRLYISRTPIAENEQQALIERFVDLLITLWKKLLTVLGF